MFQSILKLFASLVLKIKKPRVILITGSVAKSSTKEAIFSVLLQKYPFFEIAKSEGSLNTKIGVPLSILGFKHSVRWFLGPVVLFWSLIKVILYSLSIISYPKILILEMGIDKPGDFSYLLKFLRPNVAVITAIGPAHLEFFETIDRVVKEKSQIVEALPKDGYAVLNREDLLMSKIANKTTANIKYFIPKPDISTSAAIAVGQILGLKNEEIEKGLKKYQPLSGRLNLIKGISNSLIINDCYNANPLSMKYALNKLKSQSSEFKAKRKIAILGDMFELGSYTEEAHKEIGKIAKKSSDLLLCTGKNAKYIALEGGGIYFPTKEELINFIKKEIKEGDIILIKASRGMKFEEIIREISE